MNFLVLLVLVSSFVNLPGLVPELMPISDNFDAFRIQHKMLTITGIWPVERPTFNYTLRTLSSWFFTFSLFGILLIQFIHDINDFFKLAETLYIMISYVGFIVKLLVFTYHKKQFMKTINFLKDPIFVSYPEDLDHYMARTIKYFTLFANFCRLGMGGLMLLYLLYPILDGKALPFPIPYDLGMYTIPMYVFEMVGEVSAAFNHVYLDTMCWTLMAIAAAQLDILSEKILRFKEDDGRQEQCNDLDDKEASSKLKEIVEHHLAIIRLVDSIQSVFSVSILGQYAAGATVICNTIFNFVLIPISSQFIMLADYFLLLLMQLFVYCWFGNEIRIKSLQIRNACYMSSWYLTSNSARKYLFIIMERAKRPLQITAMNISVLSLNSFTSILHWAYSYLALMLNMYNKQS